LGNKPGWMCCPLPQRVWGWALVLMLMQRAWGWSLVLLMLPQQVEMAACL